jgi:hypothetical protein
MSPLARRPFLQLSLSSVLGIGVAPSALADPRVTARAESPLVGVDPVFIESGLTARWQAAMKQDLGWTARWSPMDTGEVLANLERGTVDAGLFLSHPKADELDKQGLIYNRHTLARTSVLLLGPADDLAGIRSETDPGRALAQVLAASHAGAARWLPPEPDSALARLADQLTRGMASKSAMPAAGGDGGKAAKAPAYRLMTRAQYAKAPPRGEHLKVWLADVPQFDLKGQVACSFRSRHAGAKLLLSWLQWPLAQNAIKAAHPGWQPFKE